MPARRSWLLVCSLFTLLAAHGCGDDAAAPPVQHMRDDAGRDASVVDAGRDGGTDATVIEMDANMDATTIEMDAAMDADFPDTGFDPDVGFDAGPPPGDWKCAEALWADGYCDCGCGVRDFDCVFGGCTATGCVAASCEACFTETYAWKACEPDPDPAAWKCSSDSRMDATCDCGCGIPDLACNGGGCSEPECWRPACDQRHDKDGNTLAQSGPPFTWSCPAAKFGTGDGCDCGCGAADPDCGPLQIGACPTPLCSDNACDTCHDSTGRSLPQCSEELDPSNPAGWKCDAFRYGTGDGCDCGCGVLDPDCAPTAGCPEYGCRDATCDRCTDAASGPTELVGCTPASGWTCDKRRYGTGDGCDCGCGVIDPDCGGDGDACDYCHSGISANDDDYIQCEGWTCGDTSAPAWNDFVCDCGCGKPDPVCRMQQRLGCTEAGCTTPTCQQCNDDQGTPDTSDDTRVACTGPRWNETAGNGDCAPAIYGQDGLCDCGCGAIDPDCAPGEGCAEGECTAPGCDVCFTAGALMVQCDTWTCDPSAYGDGQVCNCGCGAADPDCSNFGCKEPGCKDDTCDACHDPFGRQMLVCP